MHQNISYLLLKYKLMHTLGTCFTIVKDRFVHFICERALLNADTIAIPALVLNDKIILRCPTESSTRWEFDQFPSTNIYKLRGKSERVLSAIK